MRLANGAQRLRRAVSPHICMLHNQTVLRSALRETCCALTHHDEIHICRDALHSQLPEEYGRLQCVHDGAFTDWPSAAPGSSRDALTIAAPHEEACT